MPATMARTERQQLVRDVCFYMAERPNVLNAQQQKDALMDIVSILGWGHPTRSYDRWASDLRLTLAILKQGNL